MAGDFSARFKPGYVFAGRYVIEKRIGKGGMGTVFKATDRILDVPVALKVINPEISTDDKVLARLKREVILARKVAHSNVCRLYDIGESEGTHYVSMEFVDGLTLADMLAEKGKLPVQQGLNILRQVLLALGEAHRAGVIHRDLKPQNIMVDVQDRAFIMDFGISFSAEVERLTKTGMLIGTPRYMAPEQFGQSTTADARADIYAMGVICYQVFTGALPFAADTPVAVMYAHLHQPPIPPTNREPAIPACLETMILKALEKDPDRRFQTAAEFLAAVDEAIAAEAQIPKVATPPTVFTPRPPPSDAPQPLPRPASRISLILISLFLVAGIMGGVVYYIISNGSTITRTPAAISTAPSTSTPEKPIPPNGSVDTTPHAEAVRPQPVNPEPTSVVGTNATISNPETSASEGTPASVPIAVVLGKIEYQGDHPVLILSGRKVVLDSTKGQSADLPVGLQKLTIVAASQDVIIRENITVDVKTGETSVIPQPAMAVLDVIASPENCMVSIDMDYSQITPIAELPIQAGNHTLKVQWEELGKEKLAFFTITAGQHMKLRAVADETGINIFEQKSQ